MALFIILIAIISLFLFVIFYGKKDTVNRTDPRNYDKKRRENREYENKIFYEQVKRENYKKQEVSPINGGTNIEAQSRLRVVNDSAKIIHTTNNIDTLLSRMRLIEEHLMWFQSKGISISMDQDSSGFSISAAAVIVLKNMNGNANKEILRIAEYKLEDFKRKFAAFKTEKGKDNLAIKTYQDIDKCIASIAKVPTQHEEILVKLNNIRLSIDEIYVS